jgi:DNA mismatch repair protein MutS
MKDKTTPVRKQYLDVKRQYPGAIVFFRMGDFYETFDEDARITARELDIVLTSREMGKNNKVPLAGIPYHALENYLSRLINRGYKVAICEQTEKPGDSRGILAREVVRLVTPGTIIEPGLLDSKVNNYLVSLALAGDEVGLAYVDISTSEFACAQFPLSRLRPELERLRPSEIIVPAGADTASLNIETAITPVDGYHYELEITREKLLGHFGVATLDGFGCGHLPLAVRAAGAILHYLEETQKSVLGQLRKLATYSTDSFMALDSQTQINLELFRGARSGNVSGSLLGAIDLTRTPMGGRRLRRWLGQPLLDINELVKRQDGVAWFHENTLERTRIISLLGEMADMERLINRVKSGVALPLELVSLRRSLEIIPEMKQALADGAPGWLADGLKPCNDIIHLVSEAIADAPSGGFGDGTIFKAGFSEELDGLRSLQQNSRQHLADMESRERAATGIKNLKVGFNRVFGYYLEVSNANKTQVPDNYIRKQTLVNGERYFTPELKEYEAQVLNARERLAELEAELYDRICRQLAEQGGAVLDTAQAVAAADVLVALAEAAARYHYVRPALTEDGGIQINGGRHPVVERNLDAGSFVPNDTELASNDTMLAIITGPNMSGKSTYLRQVALIVLLAQIGSFVPVDFAVIGLVDRIFTRIGARDDLASGQSTFMVEMVETANILNNATGRSLLILDEIGRGTSTYDGLAIARAVVEYIHNAPGLGAKTLFATHYHEMVALAGFLPGVKNYNVAVTEEGGEVVFLHHIVPGGVDRSYGIHVAQLAGLPKAVIARAREVLDELEGDGKAEYLPVQAAEKSAVTQLSFMEQPSPLEAALSALDINAMTPLEALTRLYELQQRLKDERG